MAKLKRNLNNKKELLAEFFDRVIKYSAGTFVVVLILGICVTITYLLGKMLLEAVFDTPILLIPLALIVIMIVAAVHTYNAYKRQKTYRNIKSILNPKKQKRNK